MKIMWIFFAFGSALFAGATSILAKCGIRNTDSDIATAIRTIIVLIFSWLMVFITGSFTAIFHVKLKSWIFLILSGLATGASWLCYFRALQIGNVNKVVPIDKSSTVLTIILAFILLHEEITLVKAAASGAILAGTFLMITKNKASDKKTKKPWIFYAVMSAVFASLTSILGKIGIEGIDSNLGTAVRTGVVLIMAWAVVFLKKKQDKVKSIDRKEIIFICLSGIATGASWLCYYRALQDGYASVVVPIDKLSIIVTVIFSRIVFKEKLTKKSFAGLTLITAGTLAMLL